MLGIEFRMAGGEVCLLELTEIQFPTTLTARVFPLVSFICNIKSVVNLNLGMLMIK